MTPIDTPQRLKPLDGLRGLAACVVALVFHARLLGNGHFNPFAGVPVISWLQVWGWSAVDLFFVLSGYVFAHCYLRDWRMRAHTTLADFAVARIARLWPLEVATLAFAVLEMRDDPATTWQNVALSASMLKILTPDPTVILNGPSWSLSVEVICYGLFAAAAFSRPALFKAAAVCAILWGAAEVISQAPGAWTMAGLIGRGLLGFFAGCLLHNLKPLTERIPTLALVPALAMPVVVAPLGAGLLPTVLLAWPAALLLALRTNVLGSRMFVWLGDRSYAIYLSHVPIYTAIGNIALWAGIDSRMPWLAVTLIAWAVVLIVSNTLYSRLERPAQRAILNWWAGRKAFAHSLTTAKIASAEPPQGADTAR